MLTAIVLAGVALVLLVGLVSYNTLVRSRNQVAEAWSGVDVQLRRRASLVPNLVEVVGAYAEHERGTFEEVTRARGVLGGGAGVADTASASDQLSRALGRLLAVAERYPQLRAAENFRALQDDLSDVEDKVAYARQFYNRNVLDFNNRLAVFPTVVVARAFGFEPAEFFEADEEALREVRVHMRAGAASPSPPA
jgi:LemA protein